MESTHEKKLKQFFSLEIILFQYISYLSVVHIFCSSCFKPLHKNTCVSESVLHCVCMCFVCECVCSVATCCVLRVSAKQRYRAIETTRDQWRGSHLLPGRESTPAAMANSCTHSRTFAHSLDFALAPQLSIVGGWT